MLNIGLISSPLGGIRGGLYFRFLGSRREFVSKNASFEEDFISFFTNCLPYISSPLGGIRGGLYFRFFESKRELDSKFSILRGINAILLH